MGLAEEQIKNKEVITWDASDPPCSLEDFKEILKKLGYDYFVYISDYEEKPNMIELVAVAACIERDLQNHIMISLKLGFLISIEKIELSELRGFEFGKYN